MKAMYNAIRPAFFYLWLPFLIAGIIIPSRSFAQCPTSASCTPSNPPAANIAFGMGIFNVNVNNGAINNTSAGATATTGYVDYSCSIGTTLAVQNNYPVSIQTNPNATENVRIWIDFDNNGTFNTLSELVFSSNTKILHTGTITIPATAVMNLPLRMRVAADFDSSPFPSPCSTPQYSQVEDYRITLTANNIAPLPQFSADKPVTCSPTVQFQDLSQNVPNSWSWNFGDPASGASNTSTLANPSHTFSAPGFYTITLTACNANGCNTIIKTNYINYHTNLPVAATCTPATASFCCGYGITNVNLGNGLMTNASLNGSAGYEDFTCTKSATVVAGAPYPITLTSGSNPQDFRIYVDLNNDGSFTGPGEMVWQTLNSSNPSGTVIFPTTATLNIPLRMRIISDFATSPFTSCGNIQNGQAEDYTVIIANTTTKPIANFRTDSTTTCSGIVPFQDISSSGATSWYWNFGDPASGAANTSTLQNPVHTYPAAANAAYSITLIACNSFGCDTITKTNYINFRGYCKSYCPSSGHINTNRWISNVNFGSINNTTGQEPGGYGNYTHLVTDMPIGSINNPLTVTITTPLAGPVNVWIDFNKDGVFQPSEKVISKGVSVQSSIKTVTENISIPSNVTPGLTRMRVFLSYQLQNDACLMGNVDGEAEDYYINFIPNTLPITTFFTANQDSICTGAVKFTDNSLNMPTSWLWNFGDGTTSTAQNPTHNYSTTTPGIYTVSLISCKAGQCDTMNVSNLISMTVPCNSYCAVSGTSGTIRITNVQVGSINNSTALSPNGYGNFTHLSTDLIIGSNKNPVSITNVSSNNELQIWIDLNHDRIFQANERLLYRPNPTGTYLDSINIPGAAIPGPTRMRVALGYSNSLNNPCAAPGFYEVEDYTVVLKQNQSLPVVNFTATPLITCNGQATFQVTTTNSSNTYTWNFGDPASGAANNISTLANPSHTFSGPGLYIITLTACNSVGCTTITKTNYINYEPTNIVCRSVNMPGNNMPLITTYCTGLLFDRGGPNGNYFSGGSDKIVTIDPPGAGSVALTFTSFNLVPGDRIYIHDGRRFEDPVLAMFTGTSLPNNGQPIVSTTGPLTIRHYMGGSGNDAPGFAASWSCSTPTAAPIPSFTYNPETISCNGSMEFFDRSTNGPTSWSWNFGDPGSGSSNLSILQNPKHGYGLPSGFYTITLTACNSIGCNTVSKQIYLGFFLSNTAPRSANCMPLNSNRTCCGYGISRVSFYKLNHTSSLSAYVNTYENLSCQIKDTVQAGSTYPLTVINNLTGTTENVKAWIDFNDNGDFDNNELVMNSLNKTSHTAQVTISTTAVRNKPLLMRIISDKWPKTINNGCYDPEEGQVQDYGIYIVTALAAPKPLEEEPLKVEVHPNPTTGMVSLKLNYNTPDGYQLEISNVLGQVLQQKTIKLSTNEEAQLDLSGYRKGVYYIRISNIETAIVKKVIVE